MEDLKGKRILIWDSETDGLDTEKAKAKWIGFFSYIDMKHYEIEYTDFDKIKSLFVQHKDLIGFNNIEFDNPIIERQFNIQLKYKNNVDLLQVCRKRLKQMGINVDDYSMRTIATKLKLGGTGKGEIDYNIFKKEICTPEEIEKIKEYLKKDIVVTKELFEWFYVHFSPVRELLSPEDQDKLIDIKASPSSLAYRAILNKAGVKYEFSKEDEEYKKISYEGAHHIQPRKHQIKGNIVQFDFRSQYPHAIAMYNLLSKSSNDETKININLKGKYDTKTQGKKEQALMDLLKLRLKAKAEKDKFRDVSFKLLINSFSGTLGSTCFLSTYDPIAGGDMTYIGRTWLKILAKTLEVNDIYVAYGFTDGLYAVIPETSSKEEALFIVKHLSDKLNNTAPFPQETFSIELAGEYKFMRFFADNCYLWVDKNNEVGYKSTLLNKKTPQIILKLFEEYIKPKIINTLDVSFTIQELTQELEKSVDKNDVSLCAEELSVNKKDYSVSNSLPSQILTKYGLGKHLLIPNKVNIGLGASKTTKKSIGVRYTTAEEFLENNLSHKDIHIPQLMKYLKPFYKEVLK